MQSFSGGDSSNVYDILASDESWIYCCDPKTRTQSVQWVFPFELPSTAKRDCSVGKKMGASFFGMTDYYAIIVIEDEKAAISSWYTNNCLPLVMEEVRETRPRIRILLQFDNASPYTARQTTHYLEVLGIEILLRPTFSPDFSPCTFYLFAKTKEKLQRKRFTHSQEVATYEKGVEATL
ncbi:Mariner Mos1 transposase [Eumeta japonica]|uniref:Mariner Mos1 transposase n=1 Tax=Eumeta variegata TaxID=151549 RepID=A0A4C1SUF3_EUMVA|nr:Mariner Mos1 transposase [Eumeta japonica]